MHKAPRRGHGLRGLAARLLANWSAESERFVKVIPKDFKRVLEARHDATVSGLDIDLAVMEAVGG